jgi:hypothetical protein
MARVNSRLPYRCALDRSCCSILGNDGTCVSPADFRIMLVLDGKYACLYVLAVVVFGVVEALTSLTGSFLGKEWASSRVCQTRRHPFARELTY